MKIFKTIDQNKTLERVVLLLILPLVFLGVFGLAQATEAATVYTNSETGDDATGDGSVGSPFQTFHKAYTEASASDTLNLTGTFDWTDADETGDASTDGYTLDKDITIQGQGADQTIVRADDTENTAGRRVFTIDASVTVVIDGIAIQYGYTSGSSNYGGGIRNDGTLTITNCEFSYNKAASSTGGGLYNSGTATVENSTFNNNTAYYGGGGVCTSADTANLILTNSTIYSNTVTAGGGAFYGGGVYISNGDATLTNNTIVYNYARLGGGVLMYNTGEDVYFKNNIIASNDSYYGSTKDFKVYGGTVNDNGYNIVGPSESFDWGQTTGGWEDDDGDGTFELYSIGTTGTINLDSEGAAINDNPNGILTYGLSSGSIAIDAGSTDANNGVSISSSDQRTATRNGSTDIGAFEYNGGLSISEPTVQSSEITFTDNQYNQLIFSWTNGNGSRRVVFMKQANTDGTTPTDTTTYTASSVFGSGTQIGTSGWYAVYNGINNSVTVTGLVASTTYYVKVFEYNGITEGYEDYLTDTSSNNPNSETTYTPITRYADSNAVDDSGDGTSGNPYKYFHSLYSNAQPGDTLDLTGTFDWSDDNETGDVQYHGYVIDMDLTIQGQGANSTIVQADDEEATASRRVFTVDSSTAAVIKDLTIQNGYTTSSSYSGGGIRNEGTLQLIDSSIHNNRASGGTGGGFYNIGDAEVLRCSFYDNTAYYGGGGVCTSADTADLILTNSTIYSNTVTAGGGAFYGGGVYISNGDATLTNNTIVYNYARLGGGVLMYNTGEDAYFKNNIIASNDSYYGSTKDFKVYGGTVNDNGYNIVGPSESFDWGQTTGGWEDDDGDGTFELFSIGTTGTLNFDADAAINDSPTGTLTYGVTAGSIAIDAGSTDEHNGVSIPTADQRTASRNGNTDIGAFEYNGSLVINEPTTQASEVTFTENQYNQLTFSWSNGNGSKRAVFMKQASTGTASPEHNTTYTASSVFGSGTQIGTSGWYTVYNGAGSEVTVTALTAATDYIIQVFEYNGVALGAEDYLLDTSTNNPNTVATYTPQTIYCNSSSGDDTTGDGSIETPYNTFHKGYTEASPGDTINLTGTFDWTDAGESGDASTSGYTIDKTVTITGQGRDETFIQADATPDTASSRVFTTSGEIILTFNDLTIRYGDTASLYNGGGCIYQAANATMNLNSVNIDNCIAYDGSGGGIYQYSDTVLNIDKSEISNNRAGDGDGGGIHSYNAISLTMTNSSVYSNYATGGLSGGGLELSGTNSSVFTITNSTIYDNEITSGTWNAGGGIHLYDGIAYVTNCTITENISPGTGGGVYVYTSSSSDNPTLYLKNSIVAENVPGDTSSNKDVYFSGSYGSIVDNGYNVIGKYYNNGSSMGAGNWTDTNLDGTYIWNNDGGITGTLGIAENPALNDSFYGTLTYALEAGSIGIDEGSNVANGVVSIPGLDQRGGGRVSTYDVGAFEYGANLDATAPIVNSLSPINSAIEVATNSNIIITFSETVDAETGYIYLYKSEGDQLVESFDVTSDISGSGTDTITINPSSDLEEQTVYYIQIDDTAFDDTADNSFAGINDEVTWTFTTADETNPTVQSLAPNMILNVATNSNLTITFSETVDAESGYITIYDSNNIEFEAFDVTSDISGSGTDTITINPASSFEEQTSYYVLIQTTAFDDGESNNFAGIENKNTWSFRTADETSPTVSVLSPVNSGAEVSINSNLAIIFTEEVSVGFGNIYLYNGDNELFETFNVISDITGANTDTIIIDPSSNLEEQTVYYVQMDDTAFDDLSGNSFAGILNDSTWVFTTADETTPTVQTLSPTAFISGVATNSDLTITFSEAVDAESGYFAIYDSDDVEFESFDVTSDISGSGTSTITINPTSDFAEQTTYYVLIQTTAFDDSEGNSFAGIGNENTWQFSTADETSPTISGVSPESDITGVAVADNLVITFSEAVVVGSGNVYLYNGNDEIVEIFDVTSDVAGSSTDTITINPTDDLAGGTVHYLLIDTTAFDDVNGNSFAGVLSSSTWTFTTVSTGRILPPTIYIPNVGTVVATDIQTETENNSSEEVQLEVDDDTTDEPTEDAIDTTEDNTVVVDSDSTTDVQSETSTETSSTTDNAVTEKTKLVKLPESDTVYKVNDDGTRSVFMSEDHFFSYYEDFGGIEEVSATTMASYTPAKPVTYNVGTLIKITTVPKVYLVTEEGKIQWITTEELFLSKGLDFKKVKDVDDALFPLYEVGEDIVE
jgi:hypothetical protein